MTMILRKFKIINRFFLAINMKKMKTSKVKKCQDPLISLKKLKIFLLIVLFIEKFNKIQSKRIKLKR